MPTEKQKFFRLYSEVCEDIPTSAINDAIAGGYEANAVTLVGVRQGRIINLPHLIKLIEVGLPEFVISDDLRPTAVRLLAPAALSLGI